MATETELRRVHRRPTCWVAECFVGGRSIVGVVLDISAHGAFFCPDHHGLVGFQVGQPIALAFDSEPNLAGIDLPCQVKWVGFSSTHGRWGIGLEFTAGPFRVASH